MPRAARAQGEIFWEMKKAILAVIVFIVAQIMVPILGSFVLGVGGMSTGSPTELSSRMMEPKIFSVMMLAMYVLIVAALYGFRLLSPHTGIPRRPMYALLPVAVVAMLGMSVPLSWLQEFVPLPNLIGVELGGMMRYPLGFLCIAVAGPIVEELVFRRSMLGSLLESGMRPVWGILISGVAFAAVHFNPAQLPTAFALGCMFGWLFVRTGSVIPSMVCHIVNNSLVGVLTLCDMGDDTKLADMVGSQGAAAVVAVVSAGIAVLLLRIYARQTRPLPAAQAAPAEAAAASDDKTQNAE